MADSSCDRAIAFWFSMLMPVAFRGVVHVISPTSTDGIQLDVGELAALGLLHSTDHDTSTSLFRPGCDHRTRLNR